MTDWNFPKVFHKGIQYMYILQKLITFYTICGLQEKQNFLIMYTAEIFIVWTISPFLNDFPFKGSTWQACTWNLKWLPKCNSITMESWLLVCAATSPPVNSPVYAARWGGQFIIRISLQIFCLNRFTLYIYLIYL